MIDLKVLGMEKTLAALEANMKRVKTGYEKALLKGALKVEGDAKKLFKGRNDASVKGEPPRIQLGTLMRSITHERREDMGGVFFIVGTNVEYAKRQEMGSSTNWPHPFLRPALRSNQAQILQWIKEFTHA